MITACDRRQALRTAARALGFFAAAGVLLPIELRAQLAEWERQAFAARDLEGALRAMEATGASFEATAAIALDVPDVVENGALVPVSLRCTLLGVARIALLVERNPGPLAAVFHLTPGTEPFISTRLKLMESSPVHALVQAEGGLFLAQRAVRVIQGGCVG